MQQINMPTLMMMKHLHLEQLYLEMFGFSIEEIFDDNDNQNAAEGYHGKYPPRNR
jgi:hypothetical protein